MRQASLSTRGDKRMDQEKNNNGEIIMLRSSESPVTIWPGSIQAIGRHQKGGKNAKAGKA